jgi:hypothetical protein
MMDANRLSQCRELEYILFGDLRDLLEETPNQETQRWIDAVLDALLETIPEEFALKCGDGYLKDVLDEFPSWEGQVSRLEEEYFALYRRLLELRRRLRSDRGYQEIAAKLSTDLRAWMDAFRTHLQSEQRLVLLAANLEVGGED